MMAAGSQQPLKQPLGDDPLIAPSEIETAPSVRLAMVTCGYWGGVERTCRLGLAVGVGREIRELRGFRRESVGVLRGGSARCGTRSLAC
jgi:hypothetical protein